MSANRTLGDILQEAIDKAKQEKLRAIADLRLKHDLKRRELRRQRMIDFWTGTAIGLILGLLLLAFSHA